MILDSFHRMSRNLARMRRAGQTMAALSRLDDRLLNDIGIDRSAIPGVAMELAGRPQARNNHRR
jgi:uncharacterized protein YjiS (DUF1127 family)